MRAPARQPAVTRVPETAATPRSGTPTDAGSAPCGAYILSGRRAHCGGPRGSTVLGQQDREPRAAPGLALDLDPTAERLDDPLYERQAEPRAAAGACGIAAPEGIEDALQCGRLDPLS